MCHDTQANVSGGFVKDSLKIHIYVNVSGVATGGGEQGAILMPSGSVRPLPLVPPTQDALE